MTVPFARTIPLPELLALEGQELGTSPWMTLDQARISRFAELTEDAQFIHVDPARARAEGPFGGTIAHGFLTLSLLSHLAYDTVPVPEGTVASINYGFDRLRFLTPVPSGARVRARFHCTRIGQGDGALDLHLAVTMELEDAPRPALVADWIVRLALR